MRPLLLFVLTVQTISVLASRRQGSHSSASPDVPKAPEEHSLAAKDAPELDAAYAALAKSLPVDGTVDALTTQIERVRSLLNKMESNVDLDREFARNTREEIRKYHRKFRTTLRDISVRRRKIRSLKRLLRGLESERLKAGASRQLATASRALDELGDRAANAGDASLWNRSQRRWRYRVLRQQLQQISRELSYMQPPAGERSPATASVSKSSSGMEPLRTTVGSEKASPSSSPAAGPTASPSAQSSAGSAVPTASPTTAASSSPAAAPTASPSAAVQSSAGSSVPTASPTTATVPVVVKTP